ncbi:acyltransferase GLAUCE-like isoform X1 [Tasmannia lanceolata]|uniref:acyltransferase GLAUCE-like isoform X1 n=2 Tax=Tasmannia lanceolata TaxID=3420 RepID=UPI0040637826
MKEKVISFKCGGFAIGVSNNHTTFDGISFSMFLKSLASFAAGKPLAVSPYNNLQLLAARSPPHVTFSHQELVNLESPPKGEPQVSMLETQKENLIFKVFQLSQGDISNLKGKAKIGSKCGLAITSFNVVTAHIWRCKVLATNRDCPDKVTSVLFAVNLRPRMRPPLPHSYTGNAVLMGYGATTCRELEVGPFSHLVEAIQEGTARMSDEYAKSVMDWGQLYKGFPRGDILVSSWWRLGLADVDYPWGRPIYSCPLMNPNADIVILYPDSKGSEGVNAMVTLPLEDMEKFETPFHKFLH